MQTHNFRPCAALALILFALSPLSQTQAQTPKPYTPKIVGSGESSETLASALAQARPPQASVALVVNAGAINLPPNAPPPTPGTDWRQAALDYGRIVQNFGGVAAIAPPTMTLLNTKPGEPNIYDGMPMGDALKLLVSQLNPAQWQALTSEGGLGLGDLATQDERDLFGALFPGGVLKVSDKAVSAPGLLAGLTAPAAPQAVKASGDAQGGSVAINLDTRAAGMPAAPNSKERDLSAELPQVRLRLGRRVEMMLGIPLTPAAAAGGIHMVSTMTGGRPGSPPEYQLIAAPTKPGETVYGARVRMEAPNALKKSELDYNSPTLAVAIPLTGLQTVGDLVSRIGAQAHLELYTDARYEKRSLTVLGAAPTAGAGDLLRALSLCLTGTWRQVGSAFVLTDDIIGLGTRRQLWKDFVTEAEYRRQAPLGEAGDALAKAHNPDELGSLGDPLALSDAELKPDPKTNPLGMAIPTSIMGMRIAMVAPAQMTQAQKEMARRLVDEANKKAQADPKAQPIPESVLQGSAMMMATPHLELLVPSLEAPIDMGMQAAAMLFMPSPARLKEQLKTLTDDQTKAMAALKTKTPTLPLTTLFDKASRRAVLARPKTAAEAEALIASMKKAGLNQLWLQVPFPMPGQEDVLASALHAAQGTPIHVLAVMDLFDWGLNTPPALADIAISGENSLQTAAHHSQLSVFADLMAETLPGLRPNQSLYVSPFAPGVPQTLAAWVRSVAQHPGLAGIVWRDTAPPGYDGAASLTAFLTESAPLGYTLPARLDFLRHHHADPIDISTSGDTGKADTHLAGFDESAQSAALVQQWGQYRRQINVAILRSLVPALAATPPLRLLVERRSMAGFGEDWYGSWDSPQKPLPAYHLPGENYATSDMTLTDAVVQAKAQSKIAILSVAPGTSLTPATLAARLSVSFANKPWDGFVLDVTGSKAANPLAGLMAAK